MSAKPASPQSTQWRQVGWREHIALPEFEVPSLRTKIDTGARTSALHATDQQAFEKNGAQWVSFHISAPGEPRKKRCAAPVLERRDIKNTGGKPEERFIIETIVILGKYHWHIEVSLADREQMEFDMILGRTAIRARHLLVNPGKSFVLGPPSTFAAKAVAQQINIRVEH